MKSQTIRHQIINPPKQKRAWRTRERLIRAAKKSISEKGYEATTTNQISKRAGVSVGIFYKYFRDKRDIFLEIYRTYSEQIEKAAIVELDSENWREAKLETAVRSHLQTIYESHKVDPGLHHAFAQIALKDPEFQEVRNQIRKHVQNALVNLLQTRRSEIAVANISVAAFIIDEAVEACIHQAIFFDIECDEQEMLEELTAMISAYLIYPKA